MSNLESYESLWIHGPSRRSHVCFSTDSELGDGLGDVGSASSGDDDNQGAECPAE